MRAVVVTAPGGPEALVPMNWPSPTPRPGEVLIRIDAAGVNPVDLGNRADPRWAGIKPPFILGYEFAGVVCADLGDFKVGDAVWGVLPVRGTLVGCYAEQVSVPYHLIAARPDRLSAIEAACHALAGLTALQAVARLNIDDGWVLIGGATGGVGQLAVQFAQARGLHVATWSRPEQRRMLESLGVTAWVDRDLTDPVGALSRAIGEPLSGAIDLAGNELELCLPYLAEGASCVSVASLAGNFDEAIDRNLTLHGLLVRPGRAELDNLASAIGSTVNVAIREVYPLERAAEAHVRLAHGGVNGKLVIDVSGAT